MDRITAKDIMIPLDSYPHIPYWGTLRQAIVALEQTQLQTGERRSLPRVVLVFDEKYRLMGMARRRDLLRGLGSDALQETLERGGEQDPAISRDIHPHSPTTELSMESIRERAERPVSEVITPLRITVAGESTISEVMNVMVQNNMSLAPVIDDGAVVGVVRTTDVLHRLAQVLM